MIAQVESLCIRYELGYGQRRFVAELVVCLAYLVSNRQWLSPSSCLQLQPHRHIHLSWASLTGFSICSIVWLISIQDLFCQHLTIIELTMWPCVRACVWQPTPKTADVTITKITGYVRIRILMNQWFFRIFGIHTFYATATLLNIWICMQWTDAVTLVMGADWTLHPWHHNNVGVLLRARCDTTQVMFGGVTAGQVWHNSSCNNNNMRSYVVLLKWKSKRFTAK